MGIRSQAAKNCAGGEVPNDVQITRSPSAFQWCKTKPRIVPRSALQWLYFAIKFYVNESTYYRHNYGINGHVPADIMMIMLPIRHAHSGKLL